MNQYIIIERPCMTQKELIVKRPSFAKTLGKKGSGAIEKNSSH